MTIHHVSFGTNDLDLARAFYTPIMEHLGLKLLKQTDRLIAYGLTECLFSVEVPLNEQEARAGNGCHIARSRRTSQDGG